MTIKTHNPEGFSQHDITVEAWREYHYGDGTYFIKGPTTLFLKRDDRGDSHRVVDANGVTHYPRRGWLAISWRSDIEKVSF
ncbi:hypothetical protein [Mesorhizobium sp. M1252]|uniref:hypothetical protein n=1 Tax=Mesorhizobium sp. M1252 TaxID=2957073 RepID=UPI00333A1302